MRTIGRYTIIGRLGSGGMGVVYRAAMPLTGKVVALKVCRPAPMLLETMGREGVREFFLREALAMSRIRHPNVASILDLGEAEVPGLGTVPFLVMEHYCMSLGQLMGEDGDPQSPSRRLPVDDGLFYARQLLEGLGRLHHAGLVHRDVKPFNVLLTDEERVKLIDLGLSRLRGEPERRPRGMVVGSPWYAAPEQEADPDAADERADLFSVGVTLFRMLTGWLPEDGEGQRRQASALNPELDPVFDAFLDQAMHPDPARRPASARLMLAGLDELAAHWERRRAETCALQEPPGGCSAATGPVALRSRPEKARPGEARERFGLDALFRPRPGPAHRLEAGGGLVLDHTASLAWERSGSDYPLDREEAQQYVAKLNENRYAGRDGWRLPTVAELCSLMAHASGVGGLCLPRIFDPRQRRLASADAKSFTAHWYADVERGFIGWQDDTCPIHVRAVSSGRFQAGPGRDQDSGERS